MREAARDAHALLETLRAYVSGGGTTTGWGPRANDFVRGARRCGCPCPTWRHRMTEMATQPPLMSAVVRARARARRVPRVHTCTERARSVGLRARTPTCAAGATLTSTPVPASPPPAPPLLCHTRSLPAGRSGSGGGRGRGRRARRRRRWHGARALCAVPPGLTHGQCGPGAWRTWRCAHAQLLSGQPVPGGAPERGCGGGAAAGGRRAAQVRVSAYACVCV